MALSAYRPSLNTHFHSLCSPDEVRTFLTSTSFIPEERELVKRIRDAQIFRDDFIYDLILILMEMDRVPSQNVLEETLYLALYDGNLEVARQLLKGGVRPGKDEKSALTDLQSLVETDRLNFETIKLLFEYLSLDGEFLDVVQREVDLYEHEESARWCSDRKITPHPDVLADLGDLPWLTH